MKYRIKETISKAGYKSFYPQWKFLFFWISFRYLSACGGYGISVSSTFQGAKEIIDKDISRNKIADDNRTVKTKIHSA